MKDSRRSSRLKQTCIRLKCTWISFKVFLVIELCRIDKHAHYTHIALREGTLNQAQMTLVQCAHRWYKTYSLTSTLLLLYKKL